MMKIGSSNSNANFNLFSTQFRAMASACEIVVGATRQADAESVMRLAIEEVLRIEQKYTRYKPTGIISSINLAAGKRFIECDEETNSLLDYADKLFSESDGLFDISSGVLRQIWDFRKAVIPSQKEIRASLELIGWEKILRENGGIKLPKMGMEIDFGGFGKEYATDRAVSILDQEGVKFGYVNLGGDLRAVGPKPTGEEWVMGISDPRNKGEIIASIPVASGALATSGDYEKFFELNGKRYNHLLSPVTGSPVGFWRSISILAPLSVIAGSYSTIAMLKEAEALPWLDAAGINYFAIDHSGKAYQKIEH